MLCITIEKGELYDSKNNIFVPVPETKLQLEHSLISLTKWESKWHKPFLSSEKTKEEILDYIRCMVVGKEIDMSILKRLTSDDVKKIQQYIDDPMTATTIYTVGQNKKKKSINKDVITNEVLYYYMASNQIPFECEKWHLNRLLTLLEVFAVKNDKDNKMSKRQTLQHNAKINAARRAAMKKSK